MAELAPEHGPVVSKGVRSEFERSSPEVPLSLLAMLFSLNSPFCPGLAVLIPCGFAGAAIAELAAGGRLWLGIWFGVLAFLSCFVLWRWCTIQLLAFLEHRRLRRRIAPPTHWPKVSILVPAHQEADGIASSLRSLLALDYPHYEIIVVDDGSSDATSAHAAAFIGTHGRCTVEVLRKVNGGKWSALNLAFSGLAATLFCASTRIRASAPTH